MVEIIEQDITKMSNSRFAALLTLEENQALLVDRNVNTHTAIRMFARNHGFKILIRGNRLDKTKSIVKVVPKNKKS